MEVRKVHGGRDLTGQDVVVDAVGGRPWRYWYAGERVAGPAEGPRAGALYVVKKKEDELQLLERVLAAGEGWSVLLDDEGLGAYREARVEVQPGGAFSGMRTPRTTNGAPPHRIAAFFSRGRRLVGGGCALSLFTGVDPNQQGDIGRGLLDAVPVQALEGRIEVVREAGGNHPDSKVLRTQLVQWLKENEMRLVPRDGSLRDKEVEALCRGCCGLLAVLEDTTVAAAATPGEELFFNVYAAQAVAKLGLAVVLAGGPSEELKAACGGLAEKLKGKAALGMVFYELDWLETGLAMTSAEFDAQKESVDLLTSCVTSIATAAPGPVLSQVLALGVKAFEVKASVDEHNRYFGIAAVERLSLSIRTWLVGTYSGASPSLQKTAVEELKRKLFDLQQQQHHQGARRGASDWRVAFAWIKLMVEVLTFRPILVGDDTIQRLVNDDSTGRLAEAGVTLERLKAHGWVTEHTFSKQDGNFTRCVLCESFPGLWKGGGPGNPTEYVKAKLRSLPKLSVPPELEEMLVAEETLDSPATDTEEEGKAEQEQEQEQEGEEQEEQEEAVFHGLAFFAKIGMSTAEGLLQVVEKASGWMQDKRAKVEVSSTDEKTAKELYSHALTGAMDFALMFMDNEMNLWRVRDRAVVACFEAREAVAGPMNKEELEAALTACKVYETDGRVRKTLESPDLYRGMAGFLKDSWETKAEGILGGIKATMDSLEKQQQVLLHCDPKKRGAAEAVFKKVHADLGFFVRSLSGMQQMLEVSLEFLMDIQYRQLAMEQDLKEVKDGMEKLATFLDANATMEEVCIEQKKEVLSARKVASNDLYIKLYGDVVDDEARLQQDGDTTLMEHARNMLADKDKNTLLVTGKSGSGKSTFMKKLHAHLWESYWGSIDNNDIAQNRDEDEHASPVFTPGEKKAASWNGTMSANNKEYDPNQEEGSLSNTDSDDRCDQVKHHAPVCKKCHTIPVYVSLPKLKDPSTGLVEEAFAGWGIRSANRLRKLQRDCRKGIYRLIFLLDSYDEMGSDFQYTNLYQSNNLRKWGTEWLCEGGKKDAEGIYPKVIISSRCEFLESHSNYRSFFYPTLEYTSGRSSVLTEVRIRDFSTRTCEYLNKDYVLKVEKLGAEYNVGRREVKEILDAAMASGEDVPGQQRLLGRGCFRKQPLSSDTSYAVRRFADELYHIWSPSRLFHAADTSVSELKSTPFMLSILVKVIPTMFSEQNDEAYMEEMFLRTLPEDIGKQLVDRAKYYEFSEANLGKIIDCFDQAKQATLKQTVKHALQISTRSKAMLKYDTYHTFVDQLFENSLPKIRKRNSSVAEEDLKSDLLNYSKTLARQMTLNGKARVHYANTGKAFRKKTVWEEHFSSDSTLLKDIRDGAPLSTEKAGLGGRYYAFIHKSIQEFFVARLIYDAVMQFPLLEKLSVVRGFVAYFLSVTSLDELKAKLPGVRRHFVNTCANKFGIETNSVATALLQIVDALETDWSLLDTGLVINDKAILTQFLTPKVRADRKFQKVLLSIVELSKLSFAEVPAATAISILNTAISFSGMDLSHVRVEGAELNSAIFDKTDLSHAKLCRAKLARTHFHKTILDGIDMEDVDFKQQADIMYKHVVTVANVKTKSGEERWAMVSCRGDVVVEGFPKAAFSKGYTHKQVVCTFRKEDELFIATDRGVFLVVMMAAEGNEPARLEMRETEQLDYDNQEITALAFSCDGRTLVSGTSCGDVRLLDHRRLRVVAGTPSKAIRSIAVLSLRENVARHTVRVCMGYADEVCFAANKPGGSGLHCTDDSSNGLRSIKASYPIVRYGPHARHLAVAGWKSKGKGGAFQVRIINNKTQEERVIEEKASEKGGLEAMEFSADGQVIAVGLSLGVRTWSVNTGIELRNFEIHNATALCFSESMMYATAKHENVLVWNIQNFDKIRELAGHSGGISEAVISADGQFVLSLGAADQKIKKWDLTTGELRLSTTHFNNDSTMENKPRNMKLCGPQHVVWTAEGVAWSADYGCSDFHCKRHNVRVKSNDAVLLTEHREKRTMYGVHVMSATRDDRQNTVVVSPDLKHAFVSDGQDTILVRFLSLPLLEDYQFVPPVSGGGSGVCCFSSDGSKYAMCTNSKSTITIGATKDLTKKSNTTFNLAITLDTVHKVPYEVVEPVSNVTCLEINGIGPMCFSYSGDCIAYCAKPSPPSGRHCICIDLTTKVSDDIHTEPMHTLFGHRNVIKTLAYRSDYLVSVGEKTTKVWKKWYDDDWQPQEDSDSDVAYTNSVAYNKWLFEREISKVETPLEVVDCDISKLTNLSLDNRMLLEQRQGTAESVAL